MLDCFTDLDFDCSSTVACPHQLFQLSQLQKGLQNSDFGTILSEFVLQSIQIFRAKREAVTFVGTFLSAACPHTQRTRFGMNCHRFWLFRIFNSPNFQGQTRCGGISHPVSSDAWTHTHNCTHSHTNRVKCCYIYPIHTRNCKFKHTNLSPYFQKIPRWWCPSCVLINTYLHVHE